jgi:hypothetical protein
MSALPALLKRIEELNEVLMGLDEAMGRECEAVRGGAYGAHPGRIDLINKDMAVIREQVRIRSEIAERLTEMERP